MKIFSICFLFSFILLNINNVFAQANTCATANNAGVVSGTSCGTAGFSQSVNNNGSLTGAQRTSELQGATGCGATARDVHWELFTASSTSTTIEWNGISAGGRITVFSGTCGTLTELGCDNGAAGSNLSVAITTIPTNNYYIRIQRNNNNNINGVMCIYAVSSISPGGIGTANLTAWFKTDPLAIGNVTSWTTSYPTGGSAITVTDGSVPYPQATVTATSNYNTTISFSGNTSASLQALQNTTNLDLLDNSGLGNQGSFFGNYYIPAFVDINDHIMTYVEGVGNDAIQFRNINVSGRLAIGYGLSNTVNATRNWIENYLPTTLSYKGNRSTIGSMTNFENSLLNIVSAPSQASGPTGLHFGVNPNEIATSPYNGFINEFIFFNRDLTNNEMLRVDSYLGIKYAITLDNMGGGTQGDYIATNGATIWDASASSGYHNDVIGIGRDDIEELNQKQSHTFDDTTRVYIGALSASNSANGGTFSGDISYVMMGDNGGKMCSTPAALVEMPVGGCLAPVVSRLEREWKITNTNFFQNFSIDFKLNACANLTNIDPAHLVFLIDDDGDFSNGGTLCRYPGNFPSMISITYSNPIVTVSMISTVDIPDNTTFYVTLASINTLTPLPVELLSFTTSCKNNTVQLNWSTVSEVNNAFFTIERSDDLVSFEEIATIDGSGNSATLINYSWIDKKPLGGTAYYRLKQTDFNGKVEYFDIVRTHCASFESFDVFPNPFTNSFTLQLSENTKYPMTLEVYDYLGRKVHRQIIKTAATEIMLERKLPTGTYFVKMFNDVTQVVKKLVKIK